MKRIKDNRIVKCQICKQDIPASGMPSHLQHKHDKLSSEDYVKIYGEFRKKYLLYEEKIKESDIKCEICKNNLLSHRHLIHHLKKHNVKWEDYFVKYFFNNVHPLCGCGCGAKVKLIKNGRNDKGEISYARSILSGHNNNKPGYRYNTPEQKEKMRKSAIERMKNNGSFYTPAPTNPEKEIVDYLKSCGIKNIIQSEKNILSGLELDIYLPDLNIAIEYNGNRFHSDLFRKKNYHRKKSEECQQKGIRLIHIWECDYIKKKDIVLSNLKSILGLIKNKYQARKCVIKEISSVQANNFLNENHLQGSTVSKIRLGLFSDGELVSVMTFSKLRKATGLNHIENNYELVRFCNKKDTTVIGGATKIYKFFIKKYSPEYIISYANRDWSVGNLYIKLGFKFSGYTDPGYFYVKSNHKYSRYSFTKHKLIKDGFDPLKTEYQIMTERGFFRIWDCGNLKYKWYN